MECSAYLYREEFEFEEEPTNRHSTFKVRHWNVIFEEEVKEETTLIGKPVKPGDRIVIHRRKRS
jgi:hypothetical protein